MIKISNGVEIHPTAEINVEDGRIGERTKIGAHVIIRGSYIEIGRECWIDEYAIIGGGSCFDPDAFLIAGDWLHMGRFSQINIARGVRIGHECGIGIGTSIFTHGAYESVLDGFPAKWGKVTIGSRVWLPHAWVNPGVYIGSDVVVSAMSLVNSDIPNGCLAGGIPAKILKLNAYPKTLTAQEKDKILNDIVHHAIRIFDAVDQPHVHIEDGAITIYECGAVTIFDTNNDTILGFVTPFSEIVKNQLRRNGIRFRYTDEDGEYVKWI